MTTISDQDMKAAVAKAVLETLDQGKRDLLIQNALETLLAPRKGQYSSKEPSILQELFSSELELHARNVVRGYFADDGPMREKLDGFIQEIVKKMFTGEGGALGDALADIVAEAIKKLSRGY